jgi:putative membrane protein
LNAFVRPLLLLGCLPLLILTLGLFLLVINATLLWLTGKLVDGFEVPGFWPAFWGALVISIVTIIVNKITGGGDSKLSFQRVRPADGRSTQPRLDDDDDGPVIDV